MIDGVDMMEAKHECFVRVANGETLPTIAYWLEVSPTVVRDRAAKVWRLLKHPSRRLQSEPEPCSDAGLNLPDTIRANKEIYLARLRAIRVSKGLGAIPAEWLTPFPDPKFKSVSWTDEQDSILGTMSDSEASKILNYKVSQVRARRLELGINSFSGGGCDSYKG